MSPQEIETLSAQAILMERALKVIAAPYDVSAATLSAHRQQLAIDALSSLETKEAGDKPRWTPRPGITAAQAQVDIAAATERLLTLELEGRQTEYRPWPDEAAVERGRRVYLAARYSRHPQMRECRAQLEAAGFVVTSRWINGGHELTKEGSTEAHAAERIRYAMEDEADLRAADIVVSFTEQPRETKTRGGRHVEFGMALALGKPVYVVGWRENVFHTLPSVRFFETWDECFEALAAGPPPPRQTESAPEDSSTPSGGGVHAGSSTPLTSPQDWPDDAAVERGRGRMCIELAPFYDSSLGELEVGAFRSAFRTALLAVGRPTSEQEGHDDATYELIESALDKIGAPCRAPDGMWLKIHERVLACCADLKEDIDRARSAANGEAALADELRAELAKARASLGEALETAQHDLRELAHFLQVISPNEEAITEAYHKARGAKDRVTQARALLSRLEGER